MSIPHLPHPPHLAPCDSVLFPKSGVTLKERVFNDITMTQIKSQDAFDRVSSKAVHEML